MMKKFLFFSVIFLAAMDLFAAASTLEQADTYEYDLMVDSIKKVQKPFFYGDYIIFTAEKKSRSVGIVFDFEDYKTIHSYKIKSCYEVAGDTINEIFFYVLPKPEKHTSIQYRIIIDGLWTTDPTNSESIYDPTHGLLLSKIDLPPSKKTYTEETENGFTRFICNSVPGKQIRIGGTFTNWDSWIYEMTETAPGHYEINLPLPAGTYYYAYYQGMNSFIDSTNPHKAYSADGRIVSQITVN